MKITRQEVIDLLSYHDLIKLDNSKRESILIDLFSEDDEYLNISDFFDTTYNSSIRDFLQEQYIGVKNEFLERKILILFDVIITIVDLPKLFFEKCPCCGFRTLSERGGYDICPSCYWEDDGANDDDHYSAVNRSTLGIARRNFISIGASSEQYIDFVDPDSSIKYYD